MMATVLGVVMSVLAADSPAPFYADKTNLLMYLDSNGKEVPVKTPADWEIRRKHVIENMQLVMGPMPDESRRVPLNVEVLGEEDFPKHTRKKIALCVEDWDRLPAYLLIPKGLKGKNPAVLCLHPTSSFGKGMVVGLGDKENRNYAQELAERGYVALAPDYTGFGDYVESRKLLYEKGYVSATMKGIWNHMRCVDFLQSLPEVDPERIGCIGHSLGGHNTLFLGVFDPRVKVMVTSCGFTSFPKYMKGDLTGWTHDGYMPLIASTYGKDPARMPFDFTEILGVLAPRAVFINAPMKDDNFDWSGVDDCVRAAMPVYELLGAPPDRIVVLHPDAPHDFPDEEREKAYAFLDRHLER